MLLGMYSGNLGFSVSIPNFIKVAELDTQREKKRERERERRKRERKGEKGRGVGRKEREREQICRTGTDVFSICFRK